LPRNGLPSDLDELLFVKGVSAWRLFGIQTDEMPFANLQSPQLGNSNSVANSYRSSSTSMQSGRDGQAETMFEPWANYLTLYSAERNQTYAGEPRIFVNGKDLQKLHGDLKAVMPEKWADFVVLYRQLDESARITNGGEDDDGDGDEAGESGRSENRNSSDRGSSSRSSSNPESDDSEEFELELSKPAVSQISNLMELVDVTLRFEREEDDEEVTVSIKSPFQADTRVVSLAAVFDALTILPTKRIAGRININEARVEVVATLPGLDLETAEAIVAAREQGQGRGGSSSQSSESTRVHPVWLWTEGIVDAATLRAVMPHVTCGGDVYRAEVWGQVDDRSPMVRFETILDASLGKCVPVYHRELSAPRNTISIPQHSSLGVGAGAGLGAGAIRNSGGAY